MNSSMNFNEQTPNLPVLILCYSRVKPVISLIDKLIESGIRDIYISIDGPKNQNIELIQSELLSELNNIAKIYNLDINIHHNKVNMGLARGVVGGLDWFFSNVEYGIILEDDLEIGSDFVDFMKSGIKEILNYENALLVSANQFYSGSASRKIWTTYPLIWGWSTTSLKWKVMKKLISEKKVDRSAERKWHVRGFWASGRMRAESGILDSWALPLADSFHHGKYLAYCPPENLCRNVGDDQLGVHTNIATQWMSMPIGRFEKSDLKISPNQDSIDFIDDFLEKNVFGVKYRNILSPLKSLLLINYQNIRFLILKKG